MVPQSSTSTIHVAPHYTCNSNITVYTLIVHNDDAYAQMHASTKLIINCTCTTSYSTLATPSRNYIFRNSVCQTRSKFSGIAFGKRKPFNFFASPGHVLLAHEFLRFLPEIFSLLFGFTDSSDTSRHSKECTHVRVNPFQVTFHLLQHFLGLPNTCCVLCSRHTRTSRLPSPSATSASTLGRHS